MVAMVIRLSRQSPGIGNDTFLFPTNLVASGRMMFCHRYPRSEEI